MVCHSQSGRNDTFDLSAVPELTSPDFKTFLQRKAAFYEGFARQYDAARFGGKSGAYAYAETDAALSKVVAELGYAGRRGWAALDIACGTGRIALSLARMGADVVALDPAPTMLECCRSKATAAGLESRIALVGGGAEAMPLPDGSFDLLTSFRFMPQLPTAVYPQFLREMRRVTAPGGYIVLEFANLNYALVVTRLRNGLKRIAGKDAPRCVKPHQLAHFAAAAGLELQFVIGSELPKIWMFTGHPRVMQLARTLAWGPLKDYACALVAVFRNGSPRTH